MTTAIKPNPYRELLPEGKLRIHCHPGQAKAWESKKRFVDMQSGTQGGKTCFGVDWLKREIDNCGDGDYLVVTATFPLLELKLLPEFLSVFRDLYHLGEFNESKKIFTYHSGKVRVIFGSATNPESIESATAKAAWLDEAGQKQFRRDTWEAVQRRLSIHQGRVLFTTTLYGLGWLKVEIYDAWLKGDNDIEVIQFDSTLNPAFPKAEFDRMRERMPVWKFDMFYRGRYSRPAGLIYDCFDTGTMVVAPSAMPPDWVKWPRYSGHDFGGANPAAVFIARNPMTGLVYVNEEYLPGPGWSTAQHVDEFRRITANTTVIAKAGGSHQEEEIREAYRAHGWPIQEPDILNVEAGIDRVYGIIKLGLFRIAPHLYNLIDELTSYSRKLDDKYNPTDEIEEKAKYHLCDALRGILSLSRFTPETVVKQEGGKSWYY